MLMPSIFGEDLFDNFMKDFPFFDDNAESNVEKKLYGRRGKNLMKTDIKETEGGYELEMDLPGFTKDEIKVSLENGYMTISAAKGLDKDEQDKKSGRYIRKERYAGSCERSFYVGEDITEEDIKGEFKHGILKLFVPKKEAKPAEVQTLLQDYAAMHPQKHHLLLLPQSCVLCVPDFRKIHRPLNKSPTSHRLLLYTYCEEHWQLPYSPDNGSGSLSCLLCSCQSGQFLWKYPRHMRGYPEMTQNPRHWQCIMLHSSSAHP